MAKQTNKQNNLQVVASSAPRAGGTRTFQHLIVYSTEEEQTKLLMGGSRGGLGKGFNGKNEKEKGGRR